MGRDPDATLEGATASTQVARAILLGAAAYGHDPAVLRARFDLTEAELSDPDARMPARHGVRLWEEVPRVVGDDRFGLRLGERASGAGALPVVGYVLQTSRTLREGLTRALRYVRLVQTLNHADLEVTGNTARLIVHVRPRHVEPLRHAIEFALAFLLSLAGRLTGAPLAPRRASFAHRAPQSLEDHVRVFGPDLRFAAPSTELVFDLAALERPLLSADDQLRTIVERHADAMLARIPAEASLAARTRAALIEGLRAGRTDVDEIARRLDMSARTLQRRLSETGESHSVLLDGVRRDLALRYLEDASLSLSEAAFLLGFADQTTFHRAFVRWTGRTPGAFRRALSPSRT